VIVQVSDAVAMEALGAGLAVDCEPGLSIFLRGVLGAGKTTLARGFLRALGHAGAVKSPTYTLVEPYELAVGNVYHFDLYRLSDAEELEYIGVRDYFRADAVCLVEWPERAPDRLPQPDVDISIDIDTGFALEGQVQARRVTLRAPTPPGLLLLKRAGAHKT
jgi:tRNA threonylcarbamoyladenosine biosynthesis protein TsaE